MTRGKTLEFQAKDTDFVSLGRASTNIKLTHNITPQEFVDIYERISCSYNFQITDEFIDRFWEEKTFWGAKRRASIANIMRYFIDFVLDAHNLLEKDIQIEPLVREFRQSGDIYMIRHTCSLALLASIYLSQGYSVEFTLDSEGKKPDLFVNKIPADLKVIQQSDLEEIHRKKGRTFLTKLSEDLCYDIGKAIQNRLHDGIKQADLVFVDITEKSLSSMWLQEGFDNLGNLVPEPKRFRVVFFCKIGPNVFIGREQTYSFFATYVDIEPTFWGFIKKSDRTIKHTLLGGPPNLC